MTLTITSIKQINELVAEQLGWHLVTIKANYDNYTSDIDKWCPKKIDELSLENWLHSKCEEGYSYYDYVPDFVNDHYWNNQLLDYLLINEQCKVTYNLYPDRTEINIEYLGFDRWYCETRVVHMLKAEQLTLCLAFLNYMGLEFTLDKKIYNDYYNS